MAIRLLSIDGGGMRGILPLLVLRYLESVSAKPAIEMFDFIAGTSTGAIIAAGLTAAADNTSKKQLTSLSKYTKRIEEDLVN